MRHETRLQSLLSKLQHSFGADKRLALALQKVFALLPGYTEEAHRSRDAASMRRADRDWNRTADLVGLLLDIEGSVWNLRKERVHVPESVSELPVESTRYSRTIAFSRLPDFPADIGPPEVVDILLQRSGMGKGLFEGLELRDHVAREPLLTPSWSALLEGGVADAKLAFQRASVDEQGRLVDRAVLEAFDQYAFRWIGFPAAARLVGERLGISDRPTLGTLHDTLIKADFVAQGILRESERRQAWAEEISITGSEPHWARAAALVGGWPLPPAPSPNRALRLVPPPEL